jgi:hypothetical protein
MEIVLLTYGSQESNHTLSANWTRKSSGINQSEVKGLGKESKIQNTKNVKSSDVPGQVRWMSLWEREREREKQNF